MVVENITGASLSGNDGDANRTYLLSSTSADLNTLNIFSNGLFLHEDTDYTVSVGAGITVTFLNAMWNVNVISLQYSITGAITSTTYASATDLVNFMGITTTYAAMGISDNQINDALVRATREIDERTKTHFASGTATPDYVAVSDEKHNGQGKYNRDYFTLKYPLPNISAKITGTVNPSTGTVVVDATTQFPTSGVICDGTNKITYTGKTGTAFTGCTGITGTVIPGITVLPYVFEISTDEQGATPTWQIMVPDQMYDLDNDTGRFYLFRDYVISSVYAFTNPPNYTPNRIKLTYIYGWEPDSSGNIPADIKRVCCMIASRDLMHTIVRKATINGLNNFNPSMINVDDQLIEETIGRYRNPLSVNT